MTQDRAAILSAMYQDDDDGGQTTDMAPRNSLAPAQTALTRRIRVGAIEYEVPSLEYVQRLERLIAQQAETMAQQRRLIDRLAMVLGRTRGAQQLHNVNLDAVRRELATKITMRDSVASL